jgi:hypothetical protein
MCTNECKTSKYVTRNEIHAISFFILQEEIKWLKKERKQGVLSGNLDPTNERKHEEGTLSSGYSKEWTKTNNISHKKMLHIPKEPAPVITKNENSFEVLYNLNDDGTQELEGRSLILTLSVCD